MPPEDPSQADQAAPDPGAASPFDTTSNPVVDPTQLPLNDHWQHGQRFAGRSTRLGPLWHFKHLGCSILEVPPGRRAWPYHHHYANDELFVVISGNGELRLGEQRYPVTAGQVFGCPAGAEPTAHQLLNTGDEPLRYLAISSMREPDIVHYPDTGKWGLIAGSAPGEMKNRSLREFITDARSVDYWDGESTDSDHD